MIRTTLNSGTRSKMTVETQMGNVKADVIKGTATFSVNRKRHTMKGIFAKLPGWGWYECEKVGKKLVAVDCLPF